MSRTFAVVVTAMLLLATACGSSEPVDIISSGIPVPSTPQSLGTSSISESSQPESASEPAINDAFIRTVVINFGAADKTDANGNSYLQQELVSLLGTAKWDKDTMQPGDFFTWYAGFVWRERLTYEQQYEKYKHPLGNDYGSFYPAKLYEPEVMKYFDVTTDYLRRDPTYYNVALGGYSVNAPGGKGVLPDVTITEWKQTDDIVKISLHLFAQDFEDRKMVLTIKLTDDGYRYASYLPA